MGNATRHAPDAAQSEPVQDLHSGGGVDAEPDAETHPIRFPYGRTNCRGSRFGRLTRTDNTLPETGRALPRRCLDAAEMLVADALL
jgi:hypothetical protein